MAILDRDIGKSDLVLFVQHDPILLITNDKCSLRQGLRQQ